MTKLSKGNLVACETCGLKMVVVAACAEGECELVCCGKPMTAASAAAPSGEWTQFAPSGAQDWQKFAAAKGSEDWKKHAEAAAPKEGKKRGKK